MWPHTTRKPKRFAAPWSGPRNGSPKQKRPAPACQAIDLMTLTSETAELFLQRPRAEQRKLLGLILQRASWQHGELRMSLKEPFAQLKLSNRTTASKNGPFGPDEGAFESGGE